MKTKVKYLAVLPLILVFLMLSSCTRDAVDEPSPFGPPSISLVFHISADPNVLYCTSQKPKSKITTSLTRSDGSPIVGTRVYFSILSGPGSFTGGGTRASVVTNQNGIATVTFSGPAGNTIKRDQFATIRGQPQTATPNYIHREVSIRLIKAN